MMLRRQPRAYVILGLLLFNGCVSSGGPSADTAALRSTVQAFFDAMELRDVAAAAQTVVPEGVFVSVSTLDGSQQTRHFSNAEWLERLPTRKREVREAFDGQPTILIDGDVGIVWTAYTFEVDGEPSHIGVDAFTLIRTEEGWRIAGGAYSVVRPDEPKPAASPP